MIRTATVYIDSTVHNVVLPHYKDRFVIQCRILLGGGKSCAGTGSRIDVSKRDIAETGRISGVSRLA